MVQTAFGAGAMAATGRARRGVARSRPARRRAIRVAAIARGADREGPATAPTGLESQRGVHVVGTTTPGWTAPRNRATKRRSARSVAASRRSPRAWRDQLQVLTFTRRRSTAYCRRTCRLRRGARRPAALHTAVVTTAAERLSAPQRPAAHRRGDPQRSGRRPSRFTRFYVSADTPAIEFSPQRIDDSAAVRRGDTVDGKIQVAFPPLHRARTPPQIAGDVFPAVQNPGGVGELRVHVLVPLHLHYTSDVSAASAIRDPTQPSRRDRCGPG